MYKGIHSKYIHAVPSYRNTGILKKQPSSLHETVNYGKK